MATCEMKSQYYNFDLHAMWYIDGYTFRITEETTNMNYMKSVDLTTDM